MSEIFVVAKRRLRFTHPSMKSSKSLADAIAKLEPGKTLEGYFEILPDNFKAQAAPEWIREDVLFDMAVKAGDLFEAAQPTPKIAIPEVKPPDKPILATRPPAVVDEELKPIKE